MNPKFQKIIKILFIIQLTIELQNRSDHAKAAANDYILTIWRSKSHMYPKVNLSKSHKRVAIKSTCNRTQSQSNVTSETHQQRDATVHHMTS